MNFGGFRAEAFIALGIPTYYLKPKDVKRTSSFILYYFNELLLTQEV